MACRCGGTFLTPILAIAGLVAAGAGGYKLLNGCGSCSGTEANTALVSTTTDDHGSCSLCPGEATECSAHVQTASATESSCCSSKDAAKVSTVAAASQPASCCSEGNAKVSTVSATSAKPDSCCMSKGEATVKTVAAAEAKSECCSATKAEKVCKEGTDGCTGDGKAGCCGGCDGEKKTEEKKADGAVATSGK